MASRDFVEDAMDSLQKDPDLSFLLVGGHTGTNLRIRRARYYNRAGLEWLKRNFDEFYNECLAEFSEE